MKAKRNNLLLLAVAGFVVLLYVVFHANELRNLLASGPEAHYMTSSAAVLNIPVGVQAAEWPGSPVPSATNRTNAPVTFGVPLPDSAGIKCSSVASPLPYDSTVSQIQLQNSGGVTQPAQFRCLGLWPDGNAEWVLVDAQLPSFTEGTLSNMNLVLGNGGGTNPSSNMAVQCAGPRSPVASCPDSNHIVVNTGAAVFLIKEANYNLFDGVTVDGNTLVSPANHQSDDGLALMGPQPGLSGRDAVSCPNGPSPTGLDPAAQACTTEYLSNQDPASNCSIEDNGPLRSLVMCQGNLDDTNGDVYMNWRTQTTFWVNHSDVGLDVALRNAQKSTTGDDFNSAYKEFDSFESKLTMNLATGTRSVAFGGANGTTNATLTSGSADDAYLYQGYSTQYAPADIQVQNCAGEGDSCFVSPIERTGSPTAGWTYDQNGFEIVKNGSVLASGGNSQYPAGWADELDASGNGVEIGGYQMSANWPGALEFSSGGNQVAVALNPDQTEFLPSPTDIQSYVQRWPAYSIHTTYFNFHAGTLTQPADPFLDFQQRLLGRLPVSNYNSAINGTDGDFAMLLPLVDPVQDDTYWEGLGKVQGCAAGDCLGDIPDTPISQGGLSMTVWPYYSWTNGGTNQLDQAWSFIRNFLERGCTPSNGSCGSLSVNGSTPGRFIWGENFYRLVEDGSIPLSDFGGWRTVCSTACPTILSKWGYPDKLNSYNGGMRQWEDESNGEDHIHTSGLVDYYFLTGNPWAYDTLQESYKDVALNQNIAYNNPSIASQSPGHQQFGANRAAGHWLEMHARESLFLCAIRDPDCDTAADTTALLGAENTAAYSLAPIVASGYPSGWTDPTNCLSYGTSPCSGGISPVRGFNTTPLSTNHDDNCLSTSDPVAPCDGAERLSYKPFQESVLEEGLYFFDIAERSVRGPNWDLSKVVAADGNQTNVPVELGDQPIREALYAIGNSSLQESFVNTGVVTSSGFVFLTFPNSLNSSPPCYTAASPNCSHISTGSGFSFGEDYFHFFAVGAQTGSTVDLNGNSWQQDWNLYMERTNNPNEWEDAEQNAVTSLILSHNPSNPISPALAANVPTLQNVGISVSPDPCVGPANCTITWTKPSSLSSSDNNSYVLKDYSCTTGGNDCPTDGKQIINWLKFYSNCLTTSTSGECTGGTGDLTNNPCSAIGSMDAPDGSGCWPAGMTPDTHWNWFASNEAPTQPQAAAISYSFTAPANLTYTFALKAWETGSGTPAVQLSSTSIAFSAQNIGTASAPQATTLMNTGNSPLSINGISVSGTNASDFTEANNCSGSLSAGSSCTITITFSPSLSGSESAQLAIADNVGGSPQNVSLSGTGSKTSSGGGGSWTQKGGTLSADPEGWAYQPSIVAAADGTLYAAWSQQTNPSVNQFATPYAAMWNGTSWQPLGAAIGHNPLGATATSEQGYSPSLATVGTTTYISWYETSGYGWNSLTPGIGSSVFVSHWDGSNWIPDNNLNNILNGGLNVATGTSDDARDPKLANINGTLYAGWINLENKEDLAPPTVSPMYDAVVVDSLTSGQWTQVGPPLTAFPGANALMTDMTIAGVDGVPYVALAEYKMTASSGATVNNGPSYVQVYKLSGGNWVQVGGNLNILAGDYGNYLAMTVMGNVPYVAWQEKTVAGHYQIYVKHWNGTTWVQDGTGSLNVDPVNGEADQPALTNDGSKVWLAWPEGDPGQKSQLYVRTLSGGAWSAPSAALNLAPGTGAPQDVALTMANDGAPQMIWSEEDANSLTMQVYEKGTDAGNPQPTNLTLWGANGPKVTISPNTWTWMHPGGDVLGSNVTDRGGASDFVYDPVIKKSIAWMFYHGPYEAENQNSLEEYDFANNRWDTVAITDGRWSEYLAGVGHTEGNFVVDTVDNEILDRGDLTESGGTAYRTYTFDLSALRGERMTPPTEYGLRSDCDASAFDPDDDLELSIGQDNGSHFYNPRTNTGSVVSSTFPALACAGLVYDTQDHVFIMFGGDYGQSQSNETWILNPKTLVWTQKFPAVSPPALREPFFAYDSVDNLSMMTEGYPCGVGCADENPAVVNRNVWMYNEPANTWTQIGTLPSDAPIESADGKYLTYDSDDQVFLLRDGNFSAQNLMAFHYESSGSQSTPFVQLSPTSLTFSGQSVGTASSAQTVQLSNTGTGNLTINTISLSGTNASDFTETNNCPVSPATLTPAAKCTFTVIFKPSASGLRTAQVQLTDNAPGSPQTIPLSGTGTSGSQIPPTITITSPAASSTVSGTITVQTSAAASGGGSITKVELYVDTILVSTATSTPYNFSFNTLALLNGTHVFSAKAYDNLGGIGTSPNVSVIVNNTTGAGPSVPTGLKVTLTTTSTASFSWNASTGTYAIAGYDVNRGGIRVATTSAISYKDTGLTPSTTYSYTVAAYDVKGNTSVPSSPLSVTTQPGAPETLTGSLTASPALGTAPVSASLSASVGGTALGTINYIFYCDRSDTGTNITTPYDLMVSAATTTSYTAHDLCTYQTAATYTTKVIVQRGTAPSAQAQSKVTVIAATTTPGFAFTSIVVTGVTDTSADLTIAMSQPASVVVRYGPTTIYGSVTDSSPDLTTVFENLGNLLPNTVYDFNVLATPEGTTTVTFSGNYLFTTQSTPNIGNGNGGNGGVGVGSGGVIAPTSTEPISIVSGPSTFPRNLYFGDTGPDVLQLQTLLQSLGFLPSAFAPTDYFGRLTEHALLLFQDDHDLNESGYLDTQSQALFNKIATDQGEAPTTPVTVPSGSSPSLGNTSGDTFTQPLDIGSSGADVTMLQEFLFNDGDYAADRITGYFGPLTSVAVSAFQAKYGIPQVGRVGPLTEAKLNSLIGGTSSATPTSTPSTTPSTTLSSSTAQFSLPGRELYFGVSGPDVQALQGILAGAGYLSSDETTGYFGPATLAAVERFQTTSGIVSAGEPGYGLVGPKTRAALAQQAQ